ncbi:unnamed protein product [Taenia asiatica]|uniref:Solute carrier family 22 member 13 n=1 Tax=Taenia asiatica TaxID=60517 RepID=A0A158R750_TAEAS|nr:unnamed protein product [Taenia asiatica]
MGEEFVHIRPKPGVLVNVSRRVPSLVEQACRNLQKIFLDKKRCVLLAGDVAKLTCAILLLILVADVLTTLHQEGQTCRTQSGFTSSSDKPHNLGIVIASFMVQISRPTSILEAVENAESYGIFGCMSEPVNGALVYTIFVLLLLEFRTKAPGAQAIAQFVGQRFGVVAHTLTITSSLLTGPYALSLDVIDVKQIRLIGLGVALLGGFLLPALTTLLPWPELFTRQTDLRFSPRLSEKKFALSEVRRALASLCHLTYGIAIFNFVIFLGFWRILGHAIGGLRNSTPTNGW